MQTTPQDKAYTITGAPRVIGDNVIIGNGGAEYGTRGYVTAYDAATGAQAWRFYTVPGHPDSPPESPALEKALPTWTGEWWEAGGGGTAWDSMAFDPALNLVYVGVGNGSPWPRYQRSPGGGDNLYLSSILALDADTGALAWYYQTTPGDNWDYTATQHILLADIDWRGEPRKVLMQAPKNGFLYVIDRVTGELLAADGYVDTTWASHVDMETGRPVETPDGDYGLEIRKVVPGPQGGHNWQPMSYSPSTRLLYLPAHDTGLWYGLDDAYTYDAGTWNVGLDVRGLLERSADDAPLFGGHLIAWDPVARKPVWRKAIEQYLIGGVMSTAGGLVFQGTADGQFTAYRDTNGERLWRVEGTTGIFAPPITYRVGGEQYVVVAAGIGGGSMGNVLPGAIINTHINEGRILAFKLGGTAPMPQSARRDLTIPEPPAIAATPDELARGETLYQEYCGFCHGQEAVSAWIVPDLRYLAPAKHGLFNQIVVDGLYEPLGMPNFSDALTDADATAIHAYVVGQARVLFDAQESAPSPEGSADAVGVGG